MQEPALEPLEPQAHTSATPLYHQRADAADGPIDERLGRLATEAGDEVPPEAPALAHGVPRGGRAQSAGRAIGDRGAILKAADVSDADHQQAFVGADAPA